MVLLSNHSLMPARRRHCKAGAGTQQEPGARQAADKFLSPVVDKGNSTLLSQAFIPRFFLLQGALLISAVVSILDLGVDAVRLLNPKSDLHKALLLQSACRRCHCCCITVTNKMDSGRPEVGNSFNNAYGRGEPWELGPDPGMSSHSTTMDITTIDGELSSHSPTTMYTSITAGPYPGVTHALTTTDIAIIAGPYPGVTSASTTMDIITIDGELSSHSPTTMYTSITAVVIAVVVIVLVCLLFVLLHYMYRHKGTYHTNEAKGTEFAESADAALQGDPALQDAGDNSRKEYFI
ncbi:PREDICTED: glycophorin-C [Mandrillus leucophaeus]|nr:PREDICTED: glycophorin-C [Mandrillus leucophaeus]